MRAVIAAIVVAVLAAAGFFIVQSTRRDLSTRVELARVDYVTSDSCKGCHPVRHQSWYRTFHRTMTQPATPATVLGDFSPGATNTFNGVTTRFTRDGNQFYMQTLDSDGTQKRFAIAMTVGSRRVQQYVARIGDRHFRLPVAWNVSERRWFHLNAGFLHPDGGDFNQHRALWDGNCIFCHNVKARPGFDWSSARFDASVEEMGIACEACHGPGAEHVRRNSNPLRRYLLHYSDRADPTIVSPTRLPKEQQVQICGHCHGQRLPEPRARIREFVSTGDPYTAGDDLNRFTKPIWRDTTMPQVDLSLRFWRDGTPRLTAYEYQGLLLTRDYQQGGLTCMHCHTMHGGDPKGMITEAQRTAAACRDCHRDIVENVSAHSKHAAGSSGSDCYACHMPKITYGLLDVHPTHRIQKPEPARAWRYAMPEACTLCHTNRTASWAARSLAAQYGKTVPNDLPAGDDFRIAENIRALLSGDVVQRAVATMALSSARSYETNARARLWAVPFLLVTMDDNYPAVRHFAWRALNELLSRTPLARETAALPRFDAQAHAAERTRVVAAWRDWWQRLDKRGIAHPGDAVPLDANLQPIEARVAALRGQQSLNAISIGE